MSASLPDREAAGILAAAERVTKKEKSGVLRWQLALGAGEKRE